MKKIIALTSSTTPLFHTQEAPVASLRDKVKNLEDNYGIHVKYPNLDLPTADEIFKGDPDHHYAFFVIQNCSSVDIQVLGVNAINGAVMDVNGNIIGPNEKVEDWGYEGVIKAGQKYIYRLMTSRLATVGPEYQIQIGGNDKDSISMDAAAGYGTAPHVGVGNSSQSFIVRAFDALASNLNQAIQSINEIATPESEGCLTVNKGGSVLTYFQIVNDANLTYYKKMGPYLKFKPQEKPNLCWVPCLTFCFNYAGALVPYLDEDIVVSTFGLTDESKKDIDTSWESITTGKKVACGKYLMTAQWLQGTDTATIKELLDNGFVLMALQTSLSPDPNAPGHWIVIYGYFQKDAELQFYFLDSNPELPTPQQEGYATNFGPDKIKGFGILCMSLAVAP